MNEILPEFPDICKVCWDIDNDTDPSGMNELLELLLTKHRRVLVIYSNMTDWVADFTETYFNRVGIDFTFREAVINRNKKRIGSCLTKIYYNEERIYPCELIEADMNHFKNWFCFAGTLCLNVQNRVVYAGRCRVVRLGTLDDVAAIKFRSTPVLCPFETCSEVIDICTHKWQHTMGSVDIKRWTGEAGQGCGKL